MEGLSCRDPTSADDLPSSASSATSAASLHLNHETCVDNGGRQSEVEDLETAAVVHPLENIHLSQNPILDVGHDMCSSEDEEEESPLGLNDIAGWLVSGEVRNVLVLSGAGVSVSAGIPDFRTPGTGLYDNLQKYNLPYPEAVFDVNFYRQNPFPFQSLAKEIWPGTAGHAPTVTHSFVKLLEEKGLLLRNYTQNIDGLEVLAGVNPSKVLECHGHFRNAHCIDCKKSYDGEACKIEMLYNNEQTFYQDDDTGSENALDEKTPAYVPSDMPSSILKKQPMNTPPTCPACGGYIKPSIVFFGEGLPPEFAQNIQHDLTQCDLLLVMGTSLKVQPVALIPELLPSHVPRVLFNRELVGDFELPFLSSMSENGGDSNNLLCRDIFEPGDCDDAVQKLCRLAGWKAELDQLHEEARERIQAGAEEHASRASSASCGSKCDAESQIGDATTNLPPPYCDGHQHYGEQFMGDE